MAILAVRLGNTYGTSNGASPIADRLLEKIAAERWQYYFNQVLPGDIRILGKLRLERPRANWTHLVKKHQWAALPLKNKDVERLIAATNKEALPKMQTAINALLIAYYGKRAEAA
jgi:hypothetical protein